MYGQQAIIALIKDAVNVPIDIIRNVQSDLNPLTRDRVIRVTLVNDTTVHLSGNGFAVSRSGIRPVNL